MGEIIVYCTEKAAEKAKAKEFCADLLLACIHCAFENDFVVLTPIGAA